MDQQKFILFARNQQVLSELSKQFFQSSIEGTISFDNLEKSPHNFLPPEVRIDGLENYIDGGKYKAILAIEIGEPKDRSYLGLTFYRRLSLAVARYLKQINLPFAFWKSATPDIHIFGKFPEIKVEPCRDDFRTPKTLGLIAEVIKTFPNDFKDKNLDIWISCATDKPDFAIELAKALDLPHVFTYCTTYSMDDRVIAFPDFNSCYDEKTFFNPFITQSKCKEAAMKPWQDNHIFWRGTILDFSRTCLFTLGQRYPQYLKIEDSSQGQYIHMTEQAKYKYLIDVRGHGWSGRLQTLLQLGRPVFIADRPYREWYFNRLIPWTHYIPIKEDLSDLIEKYEYMERHSEVYAEIVHNMSVFVEENLTPNRILSDARDLILKYGVIN